jgi:hypothetical protein
VCRANFLELLIIDAKVSTIRIATTHIPSEKERSVKTVHSSSQSPLTEFFGTVDAIASNLLRQQTDSGGSCSQLGLSNPWNVVLNLIIRERHTIDHRPPIVSARDNVMTRSGGGKKSIKESSKMAAEKPAFIICAGFLFASVSGQQDTGRDCACLPFDRVFDTMT